MTKARKVWEIQCLLVSQLKFLGYEKLKVISEHQNYELPEGYDDFEMTITKTLNQDNSISIVVEFTDYSEPPPPLYPSKIEEYYTEKYNIKLVGPSMMVDGFDIFPNGEIVDMHGEYDEDDYDD